MMSKDDSDDDEVDRCLRTETSRGDEEGTTEDDGSNILLAEEDEAEAEVILAAGRGRLRIIIAREKAEVVTTSFESVVVLPAGRTTDADGTIDEKNTTNLLWINERENNILHLYNTRFEKVSCDRFNRTDCSCV